MKLFFCLLLLCLLSATLLAETGAASICDRKESVVFYGNGIKSTKKNAADALEVVKKRLQATMAPADFTGLEFSIAYNETRGLPLDLLESAIQLLTGNTSRFWRFFMGLEVMPDWFADKFIGLAAALDRSALATTDSLKNHVAAYKTRIAEGKKMVLVAHSQGNLFGNQAYTMLNSRERQSFGMVSAANVDSSVLGADSPYTTLKSDKVILALIAAQLNLPSSPMVPNTENITVSAEDPLSHRFIESYMMAGSNSESQITGDIAAVLNSIATPSRIVTPGVITVSLTWGSEPDMDLHVHEPGSTHVFWNNLQGDSGYLDRDDRSGYGPEHYTVPGCETLATGTYRVGLDYFKGEGPETATLQIEAGLLARTYEIAMPSEYYGSTDYPVPVADITVTNDGSGSFTFDIFR